MTQIQRTEGRTVIMVDGRIDTVNAKQLEEDIREAVARPGQQFVMDCRTLTFVASSGLRVIQNTMRDVTAAGGTFKMVNVRPEVFKVLNMTGFTKFINVEPIE